MSSHPVKVGRDRVTIAHLLPRLSIKIPIQGPTRIAPIGRRGPIHPANSKVIPVRSQDVWLFHAFVVSFEHKVSSILGSAGEVQPKALPTLNEPSVTKKRIHNRFKPENDASKKSHVNHLLQLYTMIAF